MFAATAIMQCFNRLKLGELITTRHFLGLGSRGAIDQALYRLVKNGHIVRVARGVFMKRNSPMPSLLEVAKTKAAAFCKQIYVHGADAAQAIGFTTKGNQTPTFACSGRSSSFRFGEVVIRLVGVSPRKLHNGDSLGGQLIRAMWHEGKTGCTSSLMHQTYSVWKGALPDMQASASVLAHWMNNLFHWGRTETRYSTRVGSVIFAPVDLSELFPEFKHVFERFPQPAKDASPQSDDSD